MEDLAACWPFKVGNDNNRELTAEDIFFGLKWWVFCILRSTTTSQPANISTLD